MGVAINGAELELETLRRAFPSIHRSRVQTLAGVFLHSNYEWHEGRLVRYHPDVDDRMDKMQAAILDGTAPSWEAQYDQHQQRHAERSATEHPIMGEVEKIKQDYLRMDRELDELPYVFYVSPYSPICNIPDDITDEWGILACEFAAMMKSAKVDFDADSILPVSDRERFRRENERSPEEKARLREVASRLLEEIGVRVGTPSMSDAEWQASYSPAARAKRANLENANARVVGAQILDKLSSMEDQ